ncbi:endothelin-converting enzyme 2-like [Panonychus citri]|uniref:endothelin-converting enzyme 2-like n=1 Tax=Panonychus citri TaxID=50023 RepID=UPI002307E444|nr:endothelin-converting enzyme 2-like [Panonychus citri]
MEMAKAAISGDESEPRENEKLHNPGNGDNGTSVRGPTEPVDKELTRAELIQERWENAKTFIRGNFYSIIIVLTALVLLLLIAVLILSIILGTQGTITWPVKCESSSCLKVAASTLDNLDFNYDQCDNFWSYSCGNWIKHNKVPTDKGIFSVKDSIRRETNLQAFNLLHTLPITNNGHGLDMMRKFYETCMDLDRVEHHSKRFVDDYLNGVFLGWKPIGVTKLDWTKIHEYLQKDYGVAPFFKITVELNDYDPTAPTIKVSNFPSREYYWDSSFDNIQKRYRKYIEDLTAQMGANSIEARRTADDIFNYEKRLTETLTQNWNVSQLMERAKIRDLRNLLPSIKWPDFIQSYSGLNDLPFRDNTQIVIYDIAYFRSLSTILGSSNNDLFNTYLIWRFIAEYAPYLGHDTRMVYVDFQKALNGVEPSSEDGDRWEFCIETLQKFYGPGLTTLLLEKFDVQYISPAVDSLVERVKNKLKEKVNMLPWVTDRDTSERLKDKIDNLRVKFGFSEGFNSRSEMDNYYLNVILDSSLIRSVANAHIFLRKKMFENQLKSSQEVWPIPPFEPKAFYQHAGNLLYIGLGLLSKPIYQHDYPSVMHFGSLGFHIASEMLKSISFEGIFYDRFGQISEGFKIVTDDSIAALNSSSACLANKMKYVNGSSMVDIDLILPQTIIDIYGLQIAFETYLQQVSLEGQDHPLPGLYLYNDQLFFVAFAQSLCESVRSGYAANYFATMSTLPGNLRVETLVRSSPQFIKSFNCRSQDSLTCPKL